VYTEVDEVTVPYEEKETEIVVYFKKWIEPEPIIEDSVIENENNEELINV
jgi:hypothetical protein